MKSKHVIGLSLQGYEHKCISEFGLGAVQKRNVPNARSYVSSAAVTNFSYRSTKDLKKEQLLKGLGTDFQALVIVTFQSHLL